MYFDFLAETLFYTVLPTVFAGIIIVGFWHLLTRKSRQEEQTLRSKLETSEQNLGHETNTDFGTLWAVTQQRINLYHRIATTQATRSFVSSQVATGAGFTLLIVFGFIASQATSPTAAISAGAVGVVGGGLSAYIGATFMKSQSEATAQLRQFFLQPVEFARVLGAERLIETLDDKNQKAEAVQRIVSSMITTTAPKDTDAQADVVG